MTNNYTKNDILVYSGGRLRALHENPIDLKIKSFARLKEGWRYGEGGPVSQVTIDSALEWRIFLTIHGATKIAAVPGAARDITLAATVNEEYTEIIIRSDGTFSIFRDQDSREDIYETGLSMSEAKRLVLGMLGKTWTTYGGFIRMTSFTSMDAFPVSSSKIWGVAYHLSIANAWRPVVQPSATTQGDTTSKRTPSATLRFSGGLTPQSYQRLTA